MSDCGCPGPHVAAAIDAKIALAWAQHPRRFEAGATPDFLSKAVRALAIVRDHLPTCCRPQAPTALDARDR